MHIAHTSLARDYRGGDRQMELLIRELREYDIRQTAIVRNEKTAESLRALGDVAVYMSGSPLTGFRHAHKATIVHAHCGRSVQTAGLAHLRSRVPYVITRRIQKPPHKKWLTHRMYRGAGAITVVSTAVARSMQSYDPRLEPRVIHDGIDADWLRSQQTGSQTKDDLVALDGKFVVGNVGAMADAEKGQRQILQLAARLVMTEPDVHFVLIGDGPDIERYKNECTCLPNVTLLGWRDDIAAFYGRMDVLLFPSRHEGFGSAIAEAMSFGVPVIATAVGGIPEIVSDRKNGFLCDVDDINGMQEALSELLRKPALREQMSRCARATSERFTVARMAKETLRVYASIVHDFERKLLNDIAFQKRQRTPAAGNNDNQSSSLDVSASMPLSSSSRS